MHVLSISVSQVPLQQGVAPHLAPEMMQHDLLSHHWLAPHAVPHLPQFRFELNELSQPFGRSPSQSSKPDLHETRQRIGLAHKSLPLHWERRSSGSWSATHSRSSGPPVDTHKAVTAFQPGAGKVVRRPGSGRPMGRPVKSRPRQHQACRIAQGPLPLRTSTEDCRLRMRALGRIRRRLVRTRCRWIDRSWGAPALIVDTAHRRLTRPAVQQFGATIRDWTAGRTKCPAGLGRRRP